MRCGTCASCRRSATRWPSALLQQRPRAFIGVDAPDFNLGLEGRLRRAGMRTIHFVCPSIWAWRGGRVKRIARDVDHVLCLFPFEPELLRRGGVAATFVGHPLADLIPLQVPRAEARLRLGLDEREPVVAVLPGSRLGEIRLVAPPFLQAVALLHRRRPELRFVLPVSAGMRESLAPLLALHAPGAPIQLTEGHSHDALAACDVTLIASGTATLEAALFKRPMVIGYRSHGFNACLWRRLGYLPWVGLPNILCNASSSCLSCCRAPASPRRWPTRCWRSSTMGRGPSGWLRASPSCTCC